MTPDEEVGETETFGYLCFVGDSLLLRKVELTLLAFDRIHPLFLANAPLSYKVSFASSQL